VLSTAKELALYFAFMTLVMSIASLPLAPATLLAAKVAPPWLVALLASAAAAIAGTFDHWFVRRAAKLESLQRIRQKRYALLVVIENVFAKAERWAKVAPFWTVLGFAALPLPYTIVRILVPLSGYPLGRYVVAYAVGRFPRIFVIATFGTFVDIPTDILVGLLIAGVVIAVAAALVRKLRSRRGTDTEMRDEAAPGEPSRGDDSTG
jgi:uncharacterized membrane protein YdjX (TVP38/TMEM64 family)